MMTRITSKFLGAPLVAVALATAAGCSAVDLDTGGGTLDPQVQAVLDQAATALKGAQSYRFRVQRDVPANIADVAGIDRKADIRVSAVRPDKVYAENGSRRFHYDGGQIVLLDRDEKTFASAKAPANTDAMIEFLHQEWDIRPPMAGLLKRHPFSGAHLKQVTSAKLVGTESIGGVACDRITLVGDGVEWDLWFAQSDHLVRRFDVTITELEGSPRGTTLVSEWDLDADTPESRFKAPSLDGYREVDIAEMR